MDFDDWITVLEENVIQGEYGYEPGEFTVYRSHWRPAWREGLTPAQAFRRALDALTEARKDDEAKRLANWQRIQAEDAAFVRGDSDDHRRQPSPGDEPKQHPPGAAT